MRLHLKVPGWLSDLTVLLTRKLPMFLSSLNEISGGGGNMCLVWGSLRRILKFLKVAFLWVVGEGERSSVTFVVRSLGRDVSLWLQRSQGSRVF